MKRIQEQERAAEETRRAEEAQRAPARPAPRGAARAKPPPNGPACPWRVGTAPAKKEEDSGNRRGGRGGRGATLAPRRSSPGNVDRRRGGKMTVTQALSGDEEGEDAIFRRFHAAPD